MFRKEKMNVKTNNDMLKEFYSSEYKLYREELNREMDREMMNALQRSLF
ncbi:hypothetical protein [Oceanirhabdus sp. W0125-5]|nr:hypothetical protein [Oceanirhabdus sp. W0125-5]WBW98064.1 hypothetical protein OW730_04680 [Oceanirhabdus sp. W0125-5]